jgi:hypothetical protein
MIFSALLYGDFNAHRYFFGQNRLLTLFGDAPLPPLQLQTFQIRLLIAEPP